MKNRMKQKLRRELRSVRVSDELKMRILAEAAGDRFRAERKRSPMGWLAAAAAMILVVGITAGMLSLRTTQIKPHTLAHRDGGWVWICEDDALYHARKSCGGLTGMERVELELAKAQGRTACRECITVSTTHKPVESEPLEATAIPEDTAVPESTAITVSTPAPTATPEIPEVEDGPAVESAETVAPTKDVSYDVTDGLEKEQNWGGDLPVDESPSGMVDAIVSMNGIENAAAEGWTVYGEKAGEYYHLDEKCVSAKETYAQSLEEAVAAGLTNCPKCVGKGMARSVSLKAEQFGPWVLCRASMPTQVEWIKGKGAADTGSEEVRRIFSNLYPVYMSQEQAEEFISLFEAGEVKGFRTTLCMVSALDSHLWKSQTQFYANEDGVRETTLLLSTEYMEGLDSVGLEYNIVRPEYIFEEEGNVIDNTSGCFIDALRIQDTAQGIDSLMLANVSEKTNQQSCALPIRYDGKYTEEYVDYSVGIRKLEIEGEIYLLFEDDYFLCGSSDELLEMYENAKQMTCDLFGVQSTQIEIGHSWTTPPDILWYPACRIQATVFSKGMNVSSRQDSYFATYGGLYYHKVRNCSGMRGAAEITQKDFKTWKKKPCPVCLSSLPVWINEKDGYYHRAQICLDTYNLLEISVNEAEKDNALPCPKCFSEMYDGWIDHVVQSTVSVQAYAGDGVLMVEVAPELGVEWIYPEAGEYGWSESDEVQSFLAELSPSIMTEAEAEAFRTLLEKGEVIGFRYLQCEYEPNSLGLQDEDGNEQLNERIFVGDSRQGTNVLAQYPKGQEPAVAQMVVNCRAVNVRFGSDTYILNSRDCMLTMEKPGVARIEYGGFCDAETGDLDVSMLAVDVQPADVTCEVDALDGVNVEEISVGDARFVRVQDPYVDGKKKGTLLIERDGKAVEPVAVFSDEKSITVRLPDGMDLTPVSVRMTNMANGQSN